MVLVLCVAEDTSHTLVEFAEAQKLEVVALVIWNEMIIFHFHCNEPLDRNLKNIVDNRALYCGKISLFGRDFRQISLVIPWGFRAQSFNGCVK